MKGLKQLSAIALISLFVFSCSKNEKTEQTSSIPTAETTNAEEAPAEAAETPAMAEVVLNAADEMKYDKNEIRVKAGQTVRLVLNHTGTMAKTAMGHNFVLLKPGVNIEEFSLAAVQQGTAPDFEVPDALLGEVIAHTKVIGGGESVTIEFEAPEAGTYDFICSFPGHALSMNGKFIVE